MISGAEMLHQRRMGAFDQQGQRAARLLAGRESGSIRARRPWRSARRRSRAQRLTTAPWTKPKRLKACRRCRRQDRRTSAHGRGAGASSVDSGRAGFDICDRPCHSDCMPANAAERLLQHYVDNAGALPWRSAAGRAAARSLSRVAERGDAAADDGRRRDAAISSDSSRAGRRSRRWPRRRTRRCCSEWAGLGYYARARNLIACARAGRGATAAFHATEAELRAAARASAPIPPPRSPRSPSAQTRAVVDTNVARVVARYHGIERPLDQARDEIRQLADAMTPADRAGDFAQAMMDLGATICRPKSAGLRGMPARSRLHRLRERHVRSLSRRPRQGGDARTATASPSGSSATAASGWSAARPRACSAAWPRCPDRNGPTSRSHVPALAHGRATSSPISRSTCIVVARAEPDGDGWWQPLDRLAEAGLPTLYRQGGRSGAANERKPCRLSHFSPALGSDRADHLRAEPAAIAELASRADARELVWSDGARPRRARQAALAARRGRASAVPRASTAKRRVSRICRTAMPPANAYAHFQLLACSTNERRRPSPRRSASPSGTAATGHCSVCGQRPSHPRRLVAHLPELRRRALSARPTRW